MDIQGVACRIDPILDIDDAIDLGDSNGNFVRGILQYRRRIIGKNLDFDRLRNSRQVADSNHSINCAISILQSRHIVFHFAADIVHDLVDRTARTRFQANEKIAFICFAQAAAEAGSGAARIGIDFRHSLDDLFDHLSQNRRFRFPTGRFQVASLR